MSTQPDFMLWIVLGRYRDGAEFKPIDYPFGSHDIAAFPSRKAARHACRELRIFVGRGNCYVQKYGPIS